MISFLSNLLPVLISQLVDLIRGLNLWPNSWARLVDQLVNPTHGPYLWSLKNKDLFRIGLIDCPSVVGVQLVNRPRVEPKTRSCSGLDS